MASTGGGIVHSGMLHDRMRGNSQPQRLRSYLLFLVQAVDMVAGLSIAVAIAVALHDLLLLLPHLDRHA